MAEKQEKQEKQQKQDQKSQTPQVKKRPQVEENNETLVRILSYDLPGSRPVYAALTRIKGVSWAISNVICIKLGLQRNRKIGELSKDEIQKIEDYLPKLETYKFLKNRRSDPETGEEAHLFGTDLDIKKEFDIKRMKKMRSYKGVRHTARQPVRGQRTRSHFRTKNKNAAGAKRPKKEATK